MSTGLFRSRASNLGLVTQNIRWLLLLGISFVVSVFLQTVGGYNAIHTGLIFTAATVGILAVLPWAPPWAPPSPAPLRAVSLPVQVSGLGWK